MAKRRNDPSPAEDYVDQLHWRAQRKRWGSVWFEPKWKYRIGYRFPSTTLPGRIMQAVILIGFVGLIVYLILSSGMTVEGKIFYSVVFGIIFMIIFFAARDVSKDSDDDPKHLD